MSAYKYISISLVVLIVALLTINTEPANGAYYASYAPNKAHNLTVGFRQPGDRIVFRESIIKNASWMKIQIVEKTFNISKWERITMVQALDQKIDGTGAYASILKGGPGYSNVTMRFKSQRGHGIKFIVQLYAR